MSESRPSKQQRTNSDSPTKKPPVQRRRGSRQGSARSTGHRSSLQTPKPGRQQPFPSPQISEDVRTPMDVDGDDDDKGDENLHSYPTPPSINIDQRAVADEQVRNAGEQFNISRSGSPSNSPEADFANLPGGSISPTVRSFQNREKNPNRRIGIHGAEDHRIYTRDYALNLRNQVRLLSQFSVISDRGLDLEGQHIARVARTITPLDYSTISSDAALIQQVRVDLEPVISSFFYKAEHYFLPWTRLHKVLSTNTVARLLRHISGTLAMQLTEEELAAFANQIAPPLPSLSGVGGVNGQFRRTFATLILIRREQLVFSFIRARLDDGALLEVKFEGLKAVSSEFDSLFNDWIPSEIKSFKSYRWQLSPTFFAAKRKSEPIEETCLGTVDQGTHVACFKRIRYKLRSTEEVLPFEQVSRDDISGGFADVRFFKLHEDQQDLPRFTRDGNKNPIAVKTLKNDTKGTNDQYTAYVNEVYVMERLSSAISTPHMAQLLGTIEVPSSISDGERSDYHLVLEAADRNVEKLWTDTEWWKKYPRRVTDLHLAKWVARQCYGITDALAKFHDFPKKDHDMNDKIHGLHCDIKPDNLLHYENWNPDTAYDPKGTVDEILGVIQLSDFGLSSFHSTRSVENHRIAGDFLDYAAPETEFSLTHSPAADVWHIGCFLLDFATWLLDGPEGYETFAENRITTVLRGERCRFATFTTGNGNAKSQQGHPSSQNDHTIVEVNQSVLKQATYLSEHPRSSEFVRELCHIAVDYMLVMRNTSQTQISVEYSREPQPVADRLTSKKAAELLGTMIERGDKYFQPSRGAVIPFESRKRPVLELQYTVQQLQQISKRVRSGFDPAEAGLTKPGKIVVE